MDPAPIILSSRMRGHPHLHAMPPEIDWGAVHAAASWRLAVPRVPMRGRVGERLGAGTGSSLEYQDHRPYTPGDDLRHADWKAYARSNVLSIRLYREEVAPRVDFVLDTSRSIRVTPNKHRAYAQLVALLAVAAHATTADTRIVTGASVPAEPIHRPADVERLLSCDSAAGTVEEARLPLRRQSMRLVVSDFLFPHDPEVLVGRFARDGASLAFVQLTTRDEAEPEPEGGRHLVDVEGHGELDVTIDARAVREYRERFSRRRQGLARATRPVGASFTHLVAGASPRELAHALAEAGVLEPRRSSRHRSACWRCWRSRRSSPFICSAAAFRPVPSLGSFSGDCRPTCPTADAAWTGCRLHEAS